MRLVAYKYRIYPKEDQLILLNKHFGSTRWVYNWGLELKTKAWQETKKGISVFELCKQLPILKQQENTKWLADVNAQSLQSSLRCLDEAFTAFFKKRSKFPRFKSRKTIGSFKCPQLVKVDFVSGLIFVPKFREGIRTIFHREFEGVIKTATFSKTLTGKYFVSILVETPMIDNSTSIALEKVSLGVDLGIKTFATLTSGEKITNPKYLLRKLKKLRREQRRLARKKKDSNNRNKQRIRVARIYEKVTNTRKDFLHKLTHNLVCENQATTICIEDI